jgi:hypothetical protein
MNQKYYLIAGVALIFILAVYDTITRTITTGVFNITSYTQSSANPASVGEFLYWYSTSVVRFGNQFQFDHTQNRMTNAPFSYGGGNPKSYYQADVDGDGHIDDIARRGNQFIVDTNSNGVQDYWFTFGDFSDQWYFGDFDGDGSASICVLRNTVLHCQGTITPNTALSVDSTYAYGVGW